MTPETEQELADVPHRYVQSQCSTRATSIGSSTLVSTKSRFLATIDFCLCFACNIANCFQQVRNLCDPVAGRWVFKATVYKNRCLRGFVGHGDADPSNVSTLVRGKDAHSRDACGQSCSPQGLRHRPMLYRGVRRTFRLFHARQQLSGTHEITAPKWLKQ